MPSTARGTGPPHPLERFLTILAVLVCLAITAVIWWSVSQYQSMWPLPALYLIEMPLVTIVSSVAVGRGSLSAGIVTWSAVGIIAGFSIVGAFSVGFFYGPVGLILAAVGLFHDLRHKGALALHLGIGLLAALVQAAIMFGAIRLLYPAAMF